MIQQQHGEVRALDATARLAAEARVLARRAADLVKLLDAPRLNVCRDGGVRFGRPSDFGHPPAPFAKLGRIDEEL